MPCNGTRLCIECRQKPNMRQQTTLLPFHKQGIASEFDLAFTACGRYPFASYFFSSQIWGFFFCSFFATFIIILIVRIYVAIECDEFTERFSFCCGSIQLFIAAGC